MPTLQSLARSRPVRVTAASLLIATGAMGFVPYVLNDVSTQAAINAPLIRLTAAADGIVADLPQSGQYFAGPTRIPLLDLSEETGEVAELRAQADLAEAQMRLARNQLDELAGQREQLVHRAAVFTSATTASLQDSRISSAASLKGCEAERGAAFAALERARALARQGFMADAGVEKAEAAAASKDSECSSAAALLNTINTRTKAARTGVFINDGYNDAPYAVQQADRLFLQRQAIEKTLSDATAQHTQATLRLKDALARASYQAPAGTLVWATTSSAGAAVRAGEPMIDLVDCRRRFVQVALPERKAESIQPGASVDVRLIGGSEWMKGKVVNITGAAGRQDTALLAAAPGGDPGARDISIKVALPAVDPNQLSAARKCDVGRLAEVRFSRGL